MYGSLSKSQVLPARARSHIHFLNFATMIRGHKINIPFKVRPTGTMCRWPQPLQGNPPQQCNKAGHLKTTLSWEVVACLHIVKHSGVFPACDIQVPVFKHHAMLELHNCFNGSTQWLMDGRQTIFFIDFYAKPHTRLFYCLPNMLLIMETSLLAAGATWKKEQGCHDNIGTVFCLHPIYRLMEVIKQ